MRRLLLLLSVLLLGACWAVAQDSSTNPNSGASGSNQNTGQSTQGTASQTSPEASGSGQMGSNPSHMTVQGCLNGSSGNYTLTDKNGMTYQLTGDTAKLSEHVGHEVKVTGTSSAGSASATGGSAAGSSGNSQTLEVSSVKHISKTCQNAGGMAK